MMENFINQIKENKLPEHVYELLTAETGKENITAMWLYRPEHQKAALLTVLCKDRLLLQRTFDYLFIGDTFEQDGLLISMLDDSDMVQQCEDRYLFFSRYARKEDQIYGHEKDYGRFNIVDSDLVSLKARYLKEEQLLMKYTEELIVDEQVGATLFYLKNIQHDVEFLEYIRFGKPFEDFALAERLRQIEALIPEVKQFFVKHNNHYYILRQIENEDIVEYMDEYQDHLRKIKEEMKKIVLQNMKAKQPKNTPLKPTVSHPFMKDPTIRKALHPLLQTAYLEEVYFFHEITAIKEKSQHHHYYLLALVSNENRKEEKRIAEKINKELPRDMEFTIIYHTRLWIQENVYQSQHFLKSLMNGDHKIYTNDFHAKIHWDDDDAYRCDDAFIYHRREKNIYKRHLKGVERNEKAAMVSIIASELNEYFVQILINRLYDSAGYLSEISDVKVLWDLVLYADPRASQLEDQLHKLSFDLIGYLSMHRKDKKPGLHLHQDEKKKIFCLLNHLKNPHTLPQP
ncbi:hypothetical protein FIC_00233 [Flavobacteriaceae bacterium 3519-10]|nr:hypothetical protein FIC_00233 [Flavobacteriaceae bacterium 3519-10]